MSGSENTQIPSGLQSKSDTPWTEPEIYDLKNQQDLTAVHELFDQSRVNFVYDRTDLSLKEMYHEFHPDKKDLSNNNEFEDFVSSQNTAEYGLWVYYPWRKGLVHFPPKEDLKKLRTSRNRYLVKPEEQTKLFASTLAIFGLSVGSNVVEALINQGIGGHYVLVDLDVLEPTNLNRIRAPYHEVGQNKVDVVAKKISELDPFVKLSLYRNGLSPESLDEIVSQHKPQVLIDEMDDLAMKIAVRRRAQAERLPVIMATDNSDGALLDIERYDLDDKTQLFNGLIPDQMISDFENNQLPRAEAGSLIGRYFVGFERVSLRMIESLSEVGKSLPSWPQLGSAAALSGLLVAYAAKNILLGREFIKNRYEINFEKLMPLEGLNNESAAEKQKAIERLMKNA